MICSVKAVIDLQHHYISHWCLVCFVVCLLQQLVWRLLSHHLVWC